MQSTVEKYALGRMLIFFTVSYKDGRSFLWFLSSCPVLVLMFMSLFLGYGIAPEVPFLMVSTTVVVVVDCVHNLKQ